jgi:hypothetical protein
MFSLSMTLFNFTNLTTFLLNFMTISFNFYSSTTVEVIKISAFTTINLPICKNR